MGGVASRLAFAQAERPRDTAAQMLRSLLRDTVSTPISRPGQA